MDYVKSNVEAMTVELKVDGDVVPVTAANAEYVDSDPLGGGYPGAWWVVPFGPMALGAHHAEVTVTTAKAISDGQDTYGPGEIFSGYVDLDVVSYPEPIQISPNVVFHEFPSHGFGLEVSPEATIYAPFDGYIGLGGGYPTSSGLPSGKTYRPVDFYTAGVTAIAPGSDVFDLLLGAASEDYELASPFETGDKVKAGEPLIRIVGTGLSAAYYLHQHPSKDEGVRVHAPYQVVGSWIQDWDENTFGTPVEVDEARARMFLEP